MEYHIDPVGSIHYSALKYITHSVISVTIIIIPDNPVVLLVMWLTPLVYLDHSYRVIRLLSLP